MENFVKKFFAQSDFNREVFLLSSGRCVTATRVVQGGCDCIAAVPKWRRARCSEGWGGREVRCGVARKMFSFWVTRNRSGGVRRRVRLSTLELSGQNILPAAEAFFPVPRGGARWRRLHYCPTFLRGNARRAGQCGGEQHTGTSESATCPLELGPSSTTSVWPPGIAAFGRCHLYSLFARRPLIESGAAIFHAQAHFPTEPA